MISSSLRNTRRPFSGASSLFPTDDDVPVQLGTSCFATSRSTVMVERRSGGSNDTEARLASSAGLWLRGRRDRRPAQWLPFPQPSCDADCLRRAGWNVRAGWTRAAKRTTTSCWPGRTIVGQLRAFCVANFPIFPRLPRGQQSKVFEVDKDSRRWTTSWEKASRSSSRRTVVLLPPSSR